MKSSPLAAICIPILNRGDLLLNCVRSFNYPVEKLIVINNGNDVSVQEALEELKIDALAMEIVEVKTKRNIGVAASWNWFLKNFKLPYYCIAANDIIFAPDDLAKIHQRIRTLKQEFMICVDAFNSFVLMPRCVEEIGFFDENFYPAYCEDLDYWRRILLWEQDHKIGATTGVDGIGLKHLRSQTIQSDLALLKSNEMTHRKNKRYFKAKWGGSSGKEKFQRPFNRPENSIKFWTK